MTMDRRALIATGLASLAAACTTTRGPNDNRPISDREGAPQP